MFSITASDGCVIFVSSHQGSQKQFTEGAAVAAWVIVTVLKIGRIIRKVIINFFIIFLCSRVK
jgi:uncharacterized RDD family membrane protein YckC